MEELNETMDLLEDLTEEELQELNDIFDPENNLLPIHERVSYQCPKQPSRQYNRAMLSKHLEAAAVESTVGKDYIPFVKKDADYSNHKLNLPNLKPVARARTPSPLPDLTKEELDCIENATEDELVEVAAMLKMNELVTAEQVESVEHGRKPTASGILRPTLVRTQYPIQKSFSIDEDDDIEETVDVDAMVKALRSKGEDISIIVCNNQPYMDPEVLEEIAAHLLANKNIRHLSLANCNVSDSVIDSFSEALENNTKLETLNLESNFITPVGIKKLMDAIEESTTLREIRLENQYSKIGPKCEAQMAECVSKNFTLLNFGYSFETRGPRDAMNRFILRNNDLLRGIRKQGGDWYNLPAQKKLIAKFKPPWISRRPKRKGPDAEMFEGRKIIMKGSSKKKKKKGAALVNEMLDRAAQVSKRWENKEKTGELHSEYARIEEQSKKNLEDDARRAKEQELKHIAEHGDRRKGRRRNKEAADEEEQSEIVENGDGGGRRRERRSEVEGEVEGMGNATRRRRRRSGSDDGDDAGRKGDKGQDDEDDEGGRGGKSKMDKEERRKAMRGGKVVDDEQVGMDNMSMRSRKKRDVLDDDDDDVDGRNEKESEDEKIDDTRAKVKGEESKAKQKFPTAKTVGSQPVAALDALSMRNRRKKQVIDDEEEDLDALLNSVNASNDATSGTAKDSVSEKEDISVRRRKKNGTDEEESLDDILNSAKKIEKTEDEEEDEQGSEVGKERDASGKVKVPSGRAVGSQPIEKLESLSMRGRRKNQVYDDEESIDDLLKDVKTTDVEEKEEVEDEAEDEQERKRNKSEKRTDSSIKLPSGKKVGSQKVAELEALSIRERRKLKNFDDEEEEDIDALLNSASQDGPVKDKTSQVDPKGPRIPAGKKLTAQPVSGLDSVSFRDRRRQKLEEEEEQQTNQSKEEEEEKADSSGGKKGAAGKGADVRVPTGRAIAKDHVVALETLSFAERRRRKRLGLDVPEDEQSASSAAAVEDNNDGAAKEESTSSRNDDAVANDVNNNDKDEIIEEKTVYEENIDAGRERRRRRATGEDDGEEDAEKKRQARRLHKQAAEEKPEKKPEADIKPESKPEPKKAPVIIKAPETPAVDISKPMTLRERRRLKEQGLL